MVTQEIDNTSDESLETSVFSSILDLNDISDSIKVVDEQFVKDFHNELCNVTTIKRLSTIKNVEEKFINSFNYIFELKKNLRYYSNLIKVLRELKSNMEVDYFNVNLPEKINE